MQRTRPEEKRRWRRASLPLEPPLPYNTSELMVDVQTASIASGRLLELAGRLARQVGFDRVVAALEAGRTAALDGVWGSSCALSAAALAAYSPGPLLVVCPQADDIDDFVEDLGLFATYRAARFPALESLPGDQVIADEVFGERIRLMKRLTSQGPPELVATSIQALVQPVPDGVTLKQQSRSLAVGDQMAIADLSKWLVQSGFHNTSAVELPGEFALRGGLIDIFAHDWFDPIRLEFFGDQIESIRRFDVTDQRSLLRLDRIDLTAFDPQAKQRGRLTDFLPPDSWVLLVEPDEIARQGRHYLERVERPGELHSVPDVISRLDQFPLITAASIAAAPAEATCRLKIESVERFSGEIAKVRHELDTVGADCEVFVVCQTEAEMHRLAEIFAATRLGAEGKLHFPIGSLKAGFRLVAEAMVLVSSGELFQRTDLRRQSQRRLGRVIDRFVELREGDLVVHVAHGIARYRGMKLLEKGNQVEEHLVLEFHGRTRLYVPSAKIGLVQKYVGGAKSRPKLAKLGGRAWGRQKQAVEESVYDLAAEMLEMQAARAARPGITFPSDTEWQQEFDASFPYHETDDQLTVMEAIRYDMSRPRPMDRLLCGDVGFGKTELAIRATFKAVDAGYQVAILVPTTVLAAQHLRTFAQRMAEFPFEIASLSRFSTRKEQTQILERMEAGAVDVVIGTHRLAQKDVRFHNLGLVIIDEEQRFGVAIKERLKAYRQIVDVLTMTATPIPRTLHMSLLGLRDISNLETPPEDRLAVETRVTRFDAETIRHAVLRELNRDGQVFFVHNRVSDIENIARRLAEIVPEASLEIGHAQMPEGQLEEVMLAFVNREFDVLLSTTIVESGLDIPNANTIFIDEADRYGLADLHQLRGRVGRYKHRAYCYLLLNSKKPISPTAARRLRAVEEFSDLGAGFAIAMRDLEIRGAGNILGTQQSGHIAMVGYQLYCELLEQAVGRLKQTAPKTPVEVEVGLPGEAYIPRSYVAGVRQKIDLYRRLARVESELQLDDFRSELADRFGDPPGLVERLLSLAALRIAAHRWQIDAIHTEPSYAVFRYRSAEQIKQLASLSGGKLRVVDGQSAYLPLSAALTDPDQVLGEVESLLRSG